MLQALLRAVAQLDDRVFLGVVLRSLLLSLLAFAALLAGSLWAVHLLVDGGGWFGWIAGLLGGLGVLLLALWLYVPVALLIATLYVDRVAGAVERRFYPGLPPPSGAPLGEQSWDGVVLALQVLVLQLAGLVASVLLPGIGLVLGYGITGWAIGRGLFVAVAMRRMSRPAALADYRRHWLDAVGAGIVLAIIATFPPLNLLVPVLGLATMVHVGRNR